MKSIIILLLGVLFFSSCSPTLSPFTESTLKDNSWTPDELSNVQFYLSEDIVLWREAGGTDKTVENGKIKIVDGRRIEEIIFKKGTPGAFLFTPKYGHFAIGFEEDDDRYLMFGPSYKAGGRYVLLAKEWNKRNGKVTYANQTWNTRSESAFANLMVDMDKLKKTEYKSKVVSGRKI